MYFWGRNMWNVKCLHGNIMTVKQKTGSNKMQNYIKNPWTCHLYWNWSEIKICICFMQKEVKIIPRMYPWPKYGQRFSSFLVSLQANNRWQTHFLAHWITLFCNRLARLWQCVAVSINDKKETVGHQVHQMLYKLVVCLQGKPLFSWRHWLFNGRKFTFVFTNFKRKEAGNFTLKAQKGILYWILQDI